MAWLKRAMSVGLTGEAGKTRAPYNRRNRVWYRPELLAVAEVLLLRSKSKIDFVSVEGNPLKQAERLAALQAFHELRNIYEQLLQQWPRRWLGVHHMSFLNGHLHYGQAEQVLRWMLIVS